MIRNILLYIIFINGFIYYIGHFLLYLIYKKKKFGDNSCNEISSIMGNDSINFVKNNEIIFSKYNIKRKIVKLSSKVYDDDSAYSVALSGILSSFCISNPSHLKIIGIIFNEIKLFSYSVLLYSFIGIYFQSIGLAKVGIFILIFIFIYQYLFTETEKDCILKLKIKSKYDDVFNKILILNKISMIGIFLSILRLLIIVFDFV